MFELTVGESNLQFEHSLLSLSKWESKYKKPFIPLVGQEDHTNLEMLDYLKFMLLDPSQMNLVEFLTQKQINSLLEYMTDSRTATTFHQPEQETPSREGMTSELVYYWMTEFRIPFEAEAWNLNRLMTLIRICSIKKSPEKKRNKNKVGQDYRKLNEARRKASGSKG